MVVNPTSLAFVPADHHKLKVLIGKDEVPRVVNVVKEAVLFPIFGIGTRAILDQERADLSEEAAEVNKSERKRLASPH